MKTSLKIDLLVSTLAIVPFIYLAYVWNYLPETVPTHFNYIGEADGYSNKLPLVFMLLLFSILLNIIVKYIPTIDPKNKEMVHTNAFYKIRFTVAIFNMIIPCLIIYSALGNGLNSTNISLASIGLLFMGLGNYFPKLKPNYFIGIRTPWTLENDTVWKKTHSVGGKVFFASGLLISSFIWLVPIGFKAPFFIGILVIDTFIVTIYSYRIYKTIEI